MGRNAKCNCRWNGKSATVTALLESGEVILRGELKAKFDRRTVEDVAVRGDDLVFRTGNDNVALRLGAKTAAGWAKVLTSAPPGLAEKLGIDPQKRAILIGKCEDPELMAALGSAAAAGKVGVVVACVTKETQLVEAIAHYDELRDNAVAVWVVYRKGAKSPFGETAVREAMRKRGFVDTKVASVSAQSTAAKFIKRA